jgi:hypothetical protein
MTAGRLENAKCFPRFGTNVALCQIEGRRFRERPCAVPFFGKRDVPFDRRRRADWLDAVNVGHVRSRLDSALGQCRGSLERGGGECVGLGDAAQLEDRALTAGTKPQRPRAGGQHDQREGCSRHRSIPATAHFAKLSRLIFWPELGRRPAGFDQFREGSWAPPYKLAGRGQTFRLDN